MNFISRFLAGGGEQRAAWGRTEYEILTGQSAAPSFTGRTITVEQALELPAVNRCVEIIAGTIASLPLEVYGRTGSQEKVTGTPLQEMLHEEANPRMAAPELWGLVARHLVQYGEAFVQKVRSSGPLVDRLFIIHPTAIQDVTVTDSGARYTISNGAGTVTLTQREVIHFRAHSQDGIRGVSPILRMRQSIAVYAALVEFEGRWFANGAQPSGTLSIPPQLELTGEAQDRLKQDFGAAQSGLSNVGRTAVLRDGITYQPIPVNLKESEFTLAKEWAVQEIARAFGVPPIYLGVSAGNGLTYSSTAMQRADLATLAIRPTLTVIEGELNRDGDLTSTVRAKFSMDELLRPDLAIRSQAAVSLVQAKILTADEAREWFDYGEMDDTDRPAAPAAPPSTDPPPAEEGVDDA